MLVNNAGLERISPLTDPDPEVEETFRRYREPATSPTASISTGTSKGS